MQVMAGVIRMTLGLASPVKQRCGTKEKGYKAWTYMSMVVLVRVAEEYWPTVHSTRKKWGECVCLYDLLDDLLTGVRQTQTDPEFTIKQTSMAPVGDRRDTNSHSWLDTIPDQTLYWKDLFPKGG